ncbi:MAG: uroporphyrinogen-III synthase [Pseudomonadota bacterium]
MTSPLVILRPEPGASMTAKRARAAGWTAKTVPLFAIAPLDWEPPDPEKFDAVLMTSANAARFGGVGLDGYHGLPLYAVGRQTGEAARAQGFETVIEGEHGAAEMADRMRRDGMVRIFHAAGAATRPFDERDLAIERNALYEARRAAPPNLAAILPPNAIILLHSPRSAGYLDELCTDQSIDRAMLSLVAISDATLAEAGGGWRAAVAAQRPGDDAQRAAASALGGSDPIG